MPDGRKLQQERQMRHLCSNRLVFTFSASIWRGLNLSVSYSLWYNVFKKHCHTKAFEVQNDPTRSASLINLFELGRIVHIKYNPFPVQLVGKALAICHTAFPLLRRIQKKVNRRIRFCITIQICQQWALIIGRRNDAKVNITLCCRGSLRLRAKQQNLLRITELDNLFSNRV